MLKFAKQLQKRLRHRGENTEGAYLRAQATLALYNVVIKQCSLRKVFNESLPTIEQSSDKALFKEICFGTIRFYFRLEHILNQLLNHPLEEKHYDIKFLLCIGLYQLTEMGIPPHAAVNTTVSATKLLNKPWASKLVNKILRSFIRKKSKVLEATQQDQAAWYSHPQWLIDQIKSDWPDHWEQIIAANNQKPPQSLRINKQKTSVLGYTALLQTKNIPSHSVAQFPDAVIIDTPISTAELPGFAHGLCSVQDLAGQNIIKLLDLQPEQQILDACAAPGSKTCHILEAEPNIKRLVAIDVDAERLIRIKENIERLQLPREKLKMVLEDASHTKQWWDGILFDRILLDAPCSATGVIRRHPDIKLLRRATDIEQQHQLQYLLLKTLWPLLAEGGVLLYTTCSYLLSENEKVINKFLNEHPKAKVKKIKMEPAIPLKHGLQMLPTSEGSDGFYYCVLTK